MQIRNMRPISFLLIIGLAFLTLLVLSGCGSAESLAMASVSTLPDYVQSAPPRVREAYQFAAANPDLLVYQPCYCGCGAMGHTSNLSCYISDTAEDGTPIYDNHASGCGICVDITEDVMRLTREGKSQPEIRRYVDAQYSRFGPSTDTPKPPQS
jgi:hypothetical protein